MGDIQRFVPYVLGTATQCQKPDGHSGVDGTKRLGTSLMGLGLPPLFPKPEFRSRLQHSVPMPGILHPCMGLGAVLRTPLVVDLSAERESAAASTEVPVLLLHAACLGEGHSFSRGFGQVLFRVSSRCQLFSISLQPHGACFTRFSSCSFLQSFFLSSSLVVLISCEALTFNSLSTKHLDIATITLPGDNHLSTAKVITENTCSSSRGQLLPHYPIILF